MWNMGIMNSYTMEVGVTIIVISYSLLMCGRVEHGHHEQLHNGGGSHNHGHFLHSVNVWSCGTHAS